MDKNYSYKHSKWFVAFIIFTVIGLISVANSQTTSIDITGNLVNNTQTATPTTSTWQNAVFQNSLTCWAWGDPGYCGPNPIVRPSGDINFSFGMVDIHQKVNVGKALPYGGTGLVTTGFTFGWTSKNGNGWDDGRQDNLSAYVKLYSSGDSKVLESLNYNLNFLHNWTSYNWSANWVNTKVGYRENQVGNVQFGFIGMDNNYWAGPYGPEVRDISFQLKYKPDPCKNNPLFSPECPNFTQELAKNNTTPTSDIKHYSSTTDSSETLPPPPTLKENKDHDGAVAKDDDQYEEGYKEVDIDKLVDTLFKIQDNQNREEKITMQAAESAVKESDKTAQQTIKQAEKLADKLSKESIQNSMPVQPNILIEAKDKASQSLLLFQLPTTAITDSFKLPGIQQQSSTTHLQNQSTQTQNVTIVQQEQGYKPPAQSSIFSLTTNSVQAESTNNSSLSIALINPVASQSQSTTNTTINQVVALINPLKNQINETPNNNNNFLTNRADPINSIMENKPKIEERKQEIKSAGVNQNVQDNDVAGGVSISNIARTPAGFNSYMVVLSDANFYAPKEIYRNQKTVDNVRALRQLASDKIHQEMVDQQYRR